MLLALDIGNTRIKVAVFQEDRIVFIESFESKIFLNNIENILNSYPKITDMVVSSVGKWAENDFLTLKSKVKICFLDQNISFPFQNCYQTPQTVGIDRLVLSAGAVLQFPNQNRLIIDAGTCVTYDFVDEHNRYFGGAISPGFRLRYESLNNYTAKLPLLTLQAPDDWIGNSTTAAIHSGVVNGMIYEIDGFINQYLAKYANFIIILTGGDANFLAKRLKNTIFANSNFLLESLNQTFQYINKND
ncbi:type III pantothenate kinase [Flavobacterium branchiophilum]|uniref:Type III pantothenate kinase n=1 Tax=Flavobacterium branchiophilum TaxID=55197 RepID=A0A2H3KQJ1_9FLAO|nr:type III pantothenate kinase [Flavobacterium branchiophilum]PDS26722.1 pantothenate kinase [Flavobacterium branchiophilum]